MHQNKVPAGIILGTLGTVPQKRSNDPYKHYIKVFFFLCISKMYKQTAHRVFIFHHQNYNTIFAILPKEFGKEKISTDFQTFY